MALALLLALVYGFIGLVVFLRVVRNDPNVKEDDGIVIPLLLFWPLLVGALAFWKGAKFVEFVLPGGR